MKHWWRTAGEGAAIAVVAWLLVFFFHLLWEPYHLQDDLAKNRAALQAAYDDKEAKLQFCRSTLQTETTKTGFMRDQMTSQQSMLDSQQGAINSCVISLGKMNPIIMTKTGVTVIPVATKTTPFLYGSKKISYLSAIVFSTNRRLNFEGRLKCAKPVTLNSTPIMPFRRSGMSGTGILTPISDREFDLRNDDTTGDWDAVDPIYLVATSDEENIGPCVFTLQQ